MAEKRRAARAGGGGGEGEGTRGARARARSGIEPRGSRRDAPEVGGDVKLRAVWSASRRWRAARTADEDEARMTGGAPDGPGGREAQSVRSDQAAREPIKYPSETDGSRTAKCPVINSGRNRTSVTRRFVSSGISGLMRSSARRPNPNDERARRFYVRVVSGAPPPLSLALTRSLNARARPLTSPPDPSRPSRISHAVQSHDRRASHASVATISQQTRIHIAGNAIQMAFATTTVATCGPAVLR